MIYKFKNVEYDKLTEVKKYLTRIKNSEGYEIAFAELKTFLRNNEFSKKDSFSVANRYIEYALKLNINKEKIHYQILGLINQIDLNEEDYFLTACNLIRKIDVDLCIEYLIKHLDDLNCKHEVRVKSYLLLSDLYIENDKYNESFKNCVIAKDLFDKYDLFSTLKMKSLVYEKMAEIGKKEEKPDVYFSYILNYLILDMSSEILSFPSINGLERHFKMLKKREHYLLKEEMFLDQCNKFFDSIDDLIAFFAWFIEERVLKMLIPDKFKKYWKLYNLINFDLLQGINYKIEDENDAEIRITSEEVLIRNPSSKLGNVQKDNQTTFNAIIEIPKYFKKLKVFIVASNINGL